MFNARRRRRPNLRHRFASDTQAAALLGLTVLNIDFATGWRIGDSKSANLLQLKTYGKDLKISTADMNRHLYKPRQFRVSIMFYS